MMSSIYSVVKILLLIFFYKGFSNPSTLISNFIETNTSILTNLSGNQNNTLINNFTNDFPRNKNGETKHETVEKEKNNILKPPIEPKYNLETTDVNKIKINNKNDDSNPNSSVNEVNPSKTDEGRNSVANQNNKIDSGSSLNGVSISPISTILSDRNSKVFTRFSTNDLHLNKPENITVTKKKNYSNSFTLKQNGATNTIINKQHSDDIDDDGKFDGKINNKTDPINSNDDAPNNNIVTEQTNKNKDEDKYPKKKKVPTATLR